MIAPTKDWSALQMLATRNRESELLPAQQLDPQKPLRGLRVLDALVALNLQGNENKTYPEIVTKISEPYTKIADTLLDDRPDGDVGTTADILQLLADNKFAKATRFSKKVWSARSYSTAQTLLTLADTPKKRQNEVMQLIKRINGMVITPDLLATLVTSGLTVADISPSKKTTTKTETRKNNDAGSISRYSMGNIGKGTADLDIWDIESALRSGLTRKDIKVVMHTDADMVVKRFMLASPEARQAVANGVPHDLLVRILKWYTMRGAFEERDSGVNSSTYEWWVNEAKFVPYLTRYAAQGEKEATRLREILDGDPCPSNIVERLLADIEIPAILGKLTGDTHRKTASK